MGKGRGPHRTFRKFRRASCYQRAAGTSGEDANWKVVLRLHVQLCGPGRIHGPVEFVVWLVIVVPAVTPKVVLFGIDDIIASWRLHMAVSKQKIRAIIMAIRRPLCVTRR